MESPPTLSRDKLNSLVGTKINNIELYQRAFTHKSALKRYSGLTGSYETLEFMGDSVLGFIITKHLFDQYEKHQEGFLTKARTKMVRGKTLCEISKILGLEKLILMDEKGERNGWNTNEHIMEDVFEALVGAIYLDLGMVHAKQFVEYANLFPPPAQATNRPLPYPVEETAPPINGVRFTAVQVVAFVEYVIYPDPDVIHVPFDPVEGKYLKS